MEKFPSQRKKGDPMGPRPAFLDKAIREGDHEVIQAAARQGGIKAGERRRANRFMKDRIAEERAEEHRARQTEANAREVDGDILPLDSEAA